MTLEKIYLACNSMSSHDVFEVCITKGLDMTEFYSFDTYYEIPERIKKLSVKAFEIGAVNFFVLNAD